MQQKYTFFMSNILICNRIEFNIYFNCHLSVNFSQKRNFIDYSGYFMGEMAAILDFVRLGKSFGELTLP